MLFARWLPYTHLISSVVHTCALLAMGTFTASVRGGFAWAGRFSLTSFVCFVLSHFPVWLYLNALRSGSSINVYI